MISKIKVNQLKTGAVLSYVYIGLGYVISIFYTPFLLRLLGQSEYGLYNMVNSIVSYLSILNFGFASTYIRYYSGYKVKNDQKNIAKLNSMFLLIFSVLGFIALVLGTIFIFNTKFVFGNELTGEELHTAKVLTIILVLNIAVSFPDIVFNSFIIANEKFIFQKLLLIFKVLINPILVIPVLLMGYGTIGMVIVTSLINIIIQIINYIFCIKNLKMNFYFHNFDFSLIKEVTYFSYFTFLYIIMDQVLWNVDKYILGRLWGTTTVAIYSLAAQLNTYYISLATAISQVFIPRVNHIVFSNGEDEQNLVLTNLMIRVGRIQFIVLSVFMLALVFFGKPFIVMWAGIEYVDAYPIALFLIIPVTFPLLHNLGIEIQRAKNKQKFLAIVNIFIAVLNIAISIPLSSYYKGLGSAIGTAFAMLIGNLLITNLYYQFKMGINMLMLWKEILKIVPALIIPSIFGILVAIFIDLYNFKMFILFGIMFGVVYCLSIWNFGMYKDEKQLVIKPLKQLQIMILKK